MTCWDAHVPTMSHRPGVWAIEERAPEPAAVPPESPARATASPPVERGVSPAGGGAPERRPTPVAAAAADRRSAPTAVAPERRIVPTPEPARDEVLIIASRLKEFVKEEADFNTSAEVLEVLSDLVRRETRDAIRNARAEGRRTVMARDFRR